LLLVSRCTSVGLLGVLGSPSLCPTGYAVATTIITTVTTTVNGLCYRTTWVGRYQKKRAVLRSGWVFLPPVFWIFMEQGKIIEAEVPTVWVGAAPTRLTAPPPQPPRFFYRPDALPTTQPTVSKH